MLVPRLTYQSVHELLTREHEIYHHPYRKFRFCAGPSLCTPYVLDEIVWAMFGLIMMFDRFVFRIIYDEHIYPFLFLFQLFPVLNASFSLLSISLSRFCSDTEKICLVCLQRVYIIHIVSGAPRYGTNPYIQTQGSLLYNQYINQSVKRT